MGRLSWREKLGVTHFLRLISLELNLTYKQLATAEAKITFALVLPTPQVPPQEYRIRETFTTSFAYLVPECRLEQINAVY